MPSVRRDLVHAVAVLTALVAALALGAGRGPAPRTHADEPRLLLPDLQVPDTGLARLAASPMGQEGFGSSVVELQNRADAANVAEVRLVSRGTGDWTAASRDLGPRAGLVEDLGAREDIGFGKFSGILEGSRPLGAIARTRWTGGAATAHEAVAAAREVIVPLLIRDVDGLSSILYVQNDDPDDDPAKAAHAEMTVFDNASGAIRVQIVATLTGGQAVGWDTFVDREIFGSAKLPANSIGGGYLGSLRVRSDKPVAVLVYGDEMRARGASAYVGRPVSAANRIQHLPVVRANAGGDSLVAVANPGNEPVNVRVTYRGASWSPSGAGARIGQSFQLGARGAGFVDLGHRGRGTLSRPAIPAGAAPGTGFVGNATIEADTPVLAVAHESSEVGGTVDTDAAYNAFGPDDLATAFAVPAVRKQADHMSTALAVFNPGPASAGVRVDLFDDAGAAAGQASVAVAAGGLAWIDVASIAAFPPGRGRAEVAASSPVAVLVYEQRDTSGAGAEDPVVVALSDTNDTGISGSATLTPKGADVEVSIELGAIAGNPTLSAHIQLGTCAVDQGVVAYPLEAPTGGRSTTLLPGVTLADLGRREHAIRVLIETRQGAGSAACGTIPDRGDAAVMDTSIAAAVAMEAPAVVVTPPPTAPATPAASPTATRSPTPIGPTPTPDTGRHPLYLPAARRGA